MDFSKCGCAFNRYSYVAPTGFLFWTKNVRQSIWNQKQLPLTLKTDLSHEVQFDFVNLELNYELPIILRNTTLTKVPRVNPVFYYARRLVSSLEGWDQAFQTFQQKLA